MMKITQQQMDHFLLHDEGAFVDFIFVESEAPVTRERIEEVERFLKLQLPERYKAFLLEHNGGTPTRKVFLAQREGEEPEPQLVAWFLAIYDGPHENFLKSFNTFKGRIPEGTVAIARDPGGNLILLGMEGPLKGKVYYWSMESEPYDGTPTPPEALYHVADDFDTFLESLSEL